MNKTEIIDLSDFFKTKASALDFSVRLSRIIDKVYTTNFDLEAVLSEEFGLQKKDKFLTLLSNNQVDIKSNTDLSNFLNSIQGLISEISVVSMNLAFEPKESTLKALSDWFVVNTNRQVLFDLHVDRSLIAGPTFSLKGKYFDYSIKSKFDQIIADVLTCQQDRNLQKSPEAPAPPDNQTVQNISPTT